MKRFEQISDEDLDKKIEDLYINLGNVFTECVHFLFSRIREYCRDSFSFNLSLRLFVCVQYVGG
jgi:hypothetical protein